jgi:hypothetical protein
VSVGGTSMNDTIPSEYEKKFRQLSDEYVLTMLEDEENLKWFKRHGKVNIALLIKLYRQGKFDEILKDYI